MEAEHGSPDSSTSRQPEVLPAYSELPSNIGKRLGSGAPTTADNKAESSSEEDIDTDELYTDTDTEYYSIEDDEELLDLDDAQYPDDSKDLPTYEESEACYQSVDELVREVISTSQPPITTTLSTMVSSRPPLPYPVILPQRRSRKKARGFIRAYSPVLADYGISQEVFLRFLKNFHNSSQASPIFSITTISTRSPGLAPSVIATTVCAAAQKTGGIDANAQNRAPKNDFLDCMNDELFKHAGLYVMIVEYKRDAEFLQSTSGLAEPASHFRVESTDITAHQKATIAKDRRLARKTTKGPTMLLESAPLVFPDMGKKTIQVGPETLKDSTKDSKKCFAGYLDRQGRMQASSHNPNSSIFIPEQRLGVVSAIADLGSSIQSDGLVGLVSGSKVAARAEGRERRMQRLLAHDERRIARGREPRARRRNGEACQTELAHRVETTSIRRAGNIEESSAGESRDIDAGEGLSRNAAQYRAARRERRKQKEAPGAVKRVMREDVLYLMVVKMPNVAELVEASLELERSQEH